jgi:hypothetical protein
MVGTDRHEEAHMPSRQLKQQARAASSDPDGGQCAQFQSRRAGAEDVGLSRVDWVMIVSIVAFGLLMGYLAYNGCLAAAL